MFASRGGRLLEKLGWDAEWSAAFEALRPKLADLALVPARVLRQDRGWLRLASEVGERAAQISGKLSHAAKSGLELPTVGDWVAFSSEGQKATVHAVIPRRGLLARRSGGEAQAFAANVDVAFIVHGLDQPLHPRRLERAVAMAAAARAKPVVLLNKADLPDATDAALAEARQVTGGAELVVLSARDGRGFDALEAELRSGHTGVLLGPSGAGKSSIANRLLGEARLAVGEVRARDAKGRHTTTHRELFLLPSGGMLIDGPGVRELGVHEGELTEAFPEIDALASRCRFRDCAHLSEPGCAVREAIEAGQLEARRLESLQKLQRELAATASGRPTPSGRVPRGRKR